MEKLFVGVFNRSDGKGLGFDVSRYNKKDEAQAYLDQSDLDIVDMIEIDISVHISDCPTAVIRGLASTPDGVEVLSILLGRVANYNKQGLIQSSSVVGKFGPMGNMQGSDHPFRKD